VKIALECPHALLHSVEQVTDFDFLLTHLLVNGSYREYYLQKPPQRRTRILDNSTNELGRPVSLQDLSNAAIAIRPDYVCPPDYTKDKDSTIKAVMDSCFYDFVGAKILPIVQGKDLTETEECLKEYRDMGYDRVAIPYDITLGQSHTLVAMEAIRPRVVWQSLSLGFQHIHLLGMNTLEELKFYCKTREVETLDTGTPITNGLELVRFGRDELVEKKKKLDFDWVPEQDPSMEIKLKLIYFNIAYLRRLVSNE